MSFKEVEDNLESGIAKYVTKKFPKVFDEIYFKSADYNEKIDDFFRQFVGLADGEEDNKYCIKEDDGILLMFALLLNLLD